MVRKTIGSSIYVKDESIVFVHLKNIEKDSEVYNIFCNFAI